MMWNTRAMVAPLLGVMLLLPLLSCNGSNRAVPGERKLRVVCTTGMITDLATIIGGERIQCEGLMGPGVDPHLYKASAGDLERLSRADLVLYNGLHLEARLGEVLESLPGGRAAGVAEGLPGVALLAAPAHPDLPDPHVWFDVAIWRGVALRIAELLAAADTTGASYYRQNGARLSLTLDSLHTEIRAKAAELPTERRVLVTAHDAFQYFGRAYGFEVVGLQGISTSAEAGARDVQELARFIVARRIPAIFVESSVPRRTLEAVQEAVRASGGEVRIGGELFSDALGSAGTPEGTYAGMIRHNLRTILNGLGDTP